MRALGRITCVVLLGVHVAAARADTATEARFLDELARRDYDRGRFAQALDGFLLVHALTPSSGSSYNVAVSADLAGQHDVAFAFLDRYMRATDDDEGRRRDAESRLATLRSKLALVDVVTHPEGAGITVDRDELGSHGEAPRTIAVDPGERTVIAMRPGFRAARATVTATRGTTTRVELTLEPIFGHLLVAVSPPGATLRVEREGVPVPLPADQRSFRVPVGRYALRIEAPGHLPAEASVLVTEGSEARVTLSAIALPPKTGQLLVDTGSDVARLYVDGKAVAVTPATLRAVPEGRHVIRVVADGKAPWAASVHVKENSPTYVNVTLLRGRKRR